jgi:hypothetical protein
MDSFFTSIRRFFLKFTPRERDPLSGTSATHAQSISTSDRILEQLSLSMPRDRPQLPSLIPKNGDQHPPSHRTVSLASVAINSSEDNCEARAVSKCVLRRDIRAKIASLIRFLPPA